MQTISTDVLVVGAGPCGLTASTLLAAYGIRSLTVSRYRGTAHTPRAHITNLRTMEVFRDIGIQDEIAKVSQPLSFLSNYLMVTTLSGMEIARYRAYGSGANRLSDYAAASPCVPLNTPQHYMEPVLLEAARARGADIRFSNELVQLSQTPDEVQSRVRNRGTGEEYLVRSRFVIGADGGRSTVAEQSGIEFKGEAGLIPMVNLWLEADLSKYTAYRPAVLYQTFQPGNNEWSGAGTWLCVNPWNDWVFVSAGSPELTEEELVRRARSTIGDPDVAIRVKNVAHWQVNHLYATSYRKGRVFIAGDAAHRHPPSGGLGTNTSVQDAFNLVWKLRFELAGKAGPELLDSYHDERQPVGQSVVERAMKSLYNVAPVPRALGFSKGQSAEEGWASLNDLFSGRPGAEERRDALAAAVKLQDYRSNALGVELGQRYQRGALVYDGTPFPEPLRDPELYYQPTTHPGGYLPHVWIEHDRKQLSTLDLAGHGRFCLIAGIAAEPWRQAAAAVSAELGIELPVFSIGYRCEYDDVVGDWRAVREVADSGALLVRPDRHIAWRCATAPEQPTAALRAGLLQILGRKA